jgi:uncharacterized Fe-S radical SAM superfamily protein PflX
MAIKTIKEKIPSLVSMSRQKAYSEFEELGKKFEIATEKFLKETKSNISIDKNIFFNICDICSEKCSENSQRCSLCFRKCYKDKYIK